MNAQSSTPQPFRQAFQIRLSQCLHFFDNRQIEACGGVAAQFQSKGRNGLDNSKERVFGPHEIAERHGGLEDLLSLSRTVQRDQNMLEDRFGSRIRELFVWPQQ